MLKQQPLRFAAAPLKKRKQPEPSPEPSTEPSASSAQARDAVFQPVPVFQPVRNKAAPLKKHKEPSAEPSASSGQARDGGRGVRKADVLKPTLTASPHLRLLKPVSGKSGSGKSIQMCPRCKAHRVQRIGDVCPQCLEPGEVTATMEHQSQPKVYEAKVAYNAKFQKEVRGPRKLAAQAAAWQKIVQDNGLSQVLTQDQIAVIVDHMYEDATFFNDGPDEELRGKSIQDVTSKGGICVYFGYTTEPDLRNEAVDFLKPRGSGKGPVLLFADGRTITPVRKEAAKLGFRYKEVFTSTIQANATAGTFFWLSLCFFLLVSLFFFCLFVCFFAFFF